MAIQRYEGNGRMSKAVVFNNTIYLCGQTCDEGGIKEQTAGVLAKVEELYGEEGRDRIRDKIAKGKYNESDIKPSSDKQLFYDEYSRRYFESTIEEVKKADRKSHV